MKIKFYKKMLIASVIAVLNINSAYADWYSQGWNAIGARVLNDINNRGRLSKLCNKGYRRACQDLDRATRKSYRELRGMRAITAIGNAYNKRRRIHPDAQRGVPVGGRNSWAIGGGLSPDGR